MGKTSRILRAAMFVPVFLVGCAPSMDQIKLRDADTTVPSSYGVKQTAVAAAAPTATADGKTPPADPSKYLNWKNFFDDQTLKSLIGGALGKNQELAILEQEIRISNNEIMARQGEYLPKLGIKAGGGLEKVGTFTSQGAADAANGVKEDLPNINLGLVASWEVDVWGKLRSATKAALYHYLASVEGRNYVVTRLVAEIAQNYYELRALNKKVEILDQNIELQTQALEMMRLEKQAARVTELAVKRFEAEVLKNQGRRALLKQSIVEKENQLNYLSGRFPQKIDFDGTDFIAAVPKNMDAGVPTMLLENRPDVKQAELELKSAKLSVDSARARFYPALSIEAGAGFESFNTKHLFDTPASLMYNLVGNLTVPLLNRQGIKADYYSAGSKQLQAVVSFERTILKAYTETVNQLNNVENLNNMLFRAARCDYMEVLLTRRDALDAQMDLAEVKQQQMAASVALYQALGGGWKQE